MTSIDCRGALRELALPRAHAPGEAKQQGPASLRSGFVAAPRPLQARVACRAASSTGIAQPQEQAKRRLSESSVPDELASLTELVDQLSRTPSNDVTQLKQAVSELAEDLKRQISSVNVAYSPSPIASQLFQTRKPAVPKATAEPSASRDLSLFSDLDGVIPQPMPAPDSESDEEVQEPTYPRSEVIKMRSRLNKKLSESNIYNRYLVREMQYREDALKETKAVLVALISELKELANSVSDLEALESTLPSELVKAESLPSALKESLNELIEELEQQLEGVEAMRLREVPLIWFGMAEDVKVMGSFDGWTYGEQMSPESTGTMTRFSTVLKLRPGRYEVKFLVDGEWRVAPEWPTVGHGMTENNVLLVD